MEESNSRAAKLEALKKLIDNRNNKTKEAEQELILFIKNRYPGKNDFHKNDVVNTIYSIRYNGIKINNNRYPNLLEWIMLDKEVKQGITGIKQSPYNKNNSYENKIIAEGKLDGFNIDYILENLPHLNKWYKFWGGAHKTHKRRASRKYNKSGGDPLQNRISVNNVLRASNANLIVKRPMNQIMYKIANNAASKAEQALRNSGVSDEKKIKIAGATARIEYWKQHASGKFDAQWKKKALQESEQALKDLTSEKVPESSPSFLSKFKFWGSGKHDKTHKRHTHKRHHNKRNKTKRNRN